MDEQQAGAKQLLTRETGCLTQESVEARLEREPEGTVI
jgi:hypothetical protein